MTQTIPTREIRPGDVILAESPRYYGPTFTVDTVEDSLYVADTYRITGHYGARDQHPATLAGVPGSKPYRVERAH